MTDKSNKTLYLCYFGLREPLVQTQVLPYLREISKNGIKVFLLTFEGKPRETWNCAQISEMKAKLASEGIYWHFLTYHKFPSLPATIFDIFAGALFAWKLNRKEKLGVFHGRVHLPTLMGLIAKKFSSSKPKLLFDVRGFFPEEYTDAGIWKENGLIYKGAKSIENWLRREANGFVVLTEKAREIWFPESEETGFDRLGRPVEVIPCCVDLRKFEVVNDELRRQMRKELNVAEKRVVVYVGSFGGFYLTKETADFFGTLKKQDPDTFALILTQSNPEMIQPLIEKYGYSEKDLFIQKVSPNDIPKYLSAADIGVSFIKPCYSKLSSSPTKNAEYLACGLPIVGNTGVGDVAGLLEENKVGVVLTEFNEKAYLKAMKELAVLDSLGDLQEKCRTVAQEEFDLEEVGGRKYRNVYERLLR